jgi:hypothetical protein
VTEPISSAQFDEDASTAQAQLRTRSARVVVGFALLDLAGVVLLLIGGLDPVLAIGFGVLSLVAVCGVAAYRMSQQRSLIERQRAELREQGRLTD